MLKPEKSLANFSASSALYEDPVPQAGSELSLQGWGPGSVAYSLCTLASHIAFPSLSFPV